MRPLALIVIGSCLSPELVSGQVAISVCSLSQVSNSLVENAKTETVFLFAEAGLQITWVPCENFQRLAPLLRQSLLIVRVRNAPKHDDIASASLERLGRAFLADDGGPSIADVHIDLIEQAATLNGIAPSLLLGCVMSHELGHLLLGPQHELTGLMLPTWRAQEFREIATRGLKFTRADSSRLGAYRRSRGQQITRYLGLVSDRPEAAKGLLLNCR